MPTCPSFKVDSNVVGLRFAVEKCLKALPTLAVDGADPTWYPLEPNSYGDVGATITTVARNPINPTRQRRKGVVTDLEAQISFQSDLTPNNHTRLLQSFMFALAREKPTTLPLNAAQVPVTGVTALSGYAMNNSFASQVGVGDLLLAEEFSNAANNGVKTVTATGAGTVLTAGLVDEGAPPSTAQLRVVGVEATTSDFAITVGSDIRLTSASLDLTTLGLIPGEWIFVGGDAAATQFALNVGFARVDQIATSYLVLGKTSWTAVADAGTGKTIRLFFGTVIRNEDVAANIIRTPLQFERTLGSDTNGVMSQYVIGSVANELTLNIPQAEKVTVEMGFTATDAVMRDGLTGVKVGARPALVSEDAFNSSNDLRRVAFSVVGETSPLFVYSTDLTLTINNNTSGTKAIGVLGSFDINVGGFDVGGSVTAYFQDIRAVDAVRNNLDITMDIVLAKNNTGIVWDIPLMSLGNGIVTVEQDQAVTVPLDTAAAESSFGHTLLYVNFPYLPTVA